MNVRDKIVSQDQAVLQVNRWKDHGEVCVFTNGCFDILHDGHLQYLAEAKVLGHRLIVGLNADESVTRLKGEKRPIQSVSSRAYHLAALFCTDLVVIFEEDTPLQLITKLMPNVLVKGGDYEIADIVGANEVLQNNGRVEVIPFVDGYSTSQIIETIVQRYGNR